MQRAMRVVILSAAAALALAPVQARAEGYISPWVATNAGTGFNTNNLGSSFSNGRVGIGTQVGAMGKGIIGAELDLGWSPSFFGTTNDFGNNSVMNVMGNLIVGVPVGGTRGAVALLDRQHRQLLPPPRERPDDREPRGDRGHLRLDERDAGRADRRQQQRPQAVDDRRPRGELRQRRLRSRAGQQPRDRRRGLRAAAQHHADRGRQQPPARRHVDQHAVVVARDADRP